MWLCVDSRDFSITGPTPQQAWENYRDEIGVSDLEDLRSYNLTDTKPNAMKMVIVEDN